MVNYRLNPRKAEATLKNWDSWEKINNEEFTGKPKRILEATKAILVFLYLRGAWEIADPRVYYYVNIILKNDP